MSENQDTQNKPEVQTVDSTVPDQIQTDSNIPDAGALPVNSRQTPTIPVQGGQPAQPNQPAQVKPPVQPNQPVQVNQQAQKQQGIVHPSVWRSIGETMSGIPRSRPYIDSSNGQKINIEEGQTYIDKGTGQSVSGPKPPSVGAMSLAILASALEGAFAGGTQRGPGSGVRGFAAGGQATMGRQQEQQKEANDQALQDYNRRITTTEANMRMMNTAVQLGRMGKEDHDSMVNVYSGQLQDYKDNSPDVIKAEKVPEAEAKDLQKYPATDFLRVPDGVVPRLNPDTGEQVKINGVPQWDNTYSLIDKNAKTSLVDEEGIPKQWVKDGVEWGLKGMSPSLLTSKLSPNATVSAGTAGTVQHQLVMLNSLQSELNNFSKTLKLKEPIDLKVAVKTDPSLLAAIQHFQRAAGSSTQPDHQIDAMRQDPASAPYAATMMKLFGNDNLEKLKQDRDAEAKTAIQAKERDAKLLNPATDEEAKTTIGKFGKNPTDPAQISAVSQAQSILKQGVEQSANRTRAEEIARQQVEQEYQKEQQELTAAPPNWVPPDNVTDMKQNDIAQMLQAKGMKVPKKLASLYKVGHYGEDLNKIFPTRVSKGTGQLDAAHALSFITNFINPNYNAANVGAAKQLGKVLADPNRSPVVAAGTASQHLNLLKDAAVALHNGDLQAMNRVGNFFGLQFGKANIAAFKAINERVNNEVARVVAGGGTAHEAEIAQNRDLLNEDQSPEQIENVIRASIGLMSGRLGEIDDDHMNYFGTHMHASPTTTRLFQQYGFPTPWEEKQTQGQGNQNNQNQGQPKNNIVPAGAIPGRDANGNIIGYKKPDGTIVKF